MERSVSLLPSAGGCKFHFVSALLSCDLVFAVHLPAKQETRDFRNYQAATCPASNEENYIRTGAGEEEGDDGLPETTLVCQYSLLEDFSISVRRNLMNCIVKTQFSPLMRQFNSNISRRVSVKVYERYPRRKV